MPKLDLRRRNHEISKFLTAGRSTMKMSLLDVAMTANLTLEEATSIEQSPIHAPLCDLARFVDAIDFRLGGPLSLVLCGIEPDWPPDYPSEHLH